MRYLNTIIAILIFGCLNVTKTNAQAAYDMQAANALNSANWFELKRFYESYSDSLSPMLKSFSEAMIAHNFCEPDSACTAINNLIVNYPNEIGQYNIINMTLLKSSHLAKQRNYAVASNILEQCISTNTNLGSDIDYFRVICDQYKALERIGNINRLTFDNENFNGIIPFDIDTIWAKGKPNYAIMFNANVNDKHIRILFDSGASVNVISPKVAKYLDIESLNIGTQSNGIGGSIEGEYAIVQKIKLGNIKIDNVPFHMFDITTRVDSIDNQYFNHLDMILGIDFINLFDELQIDFRNKQLLIPSELTKLENDESQNLCGGTNGLFTIEAKINDNHMPISFDTGAGSSILQNTYYLKFKSDIDANCEIDTLRQAGGGGIKIEKAYNIKNLKIEIDDIDYIFPEIMVSTEPDNFNSVYANLGMDYFTKFSRIIINMKNRFVKLER